MFYQKGSHLFFIAERQMSGGLFPGMSCAQAPCFPPVTGNAASQSAFHPQHSHREAKWRADRSG
jgi:hypothetical protein